MNNDNHLEDAERVFTKPKPTPTPKSYGQEQRAIVENMQRLRRERLEREAEAKPR